MKKFLIYVVVVVTLLFLGFTVYYISQNDEIISLTISTENVVYLNKGESYELPIKWTKPSDNTTLTVTVASTSVLSYDSATKMFTAVGGGFTPVTISTTNKDFGPFTFEVRVGDGKANSPYVISTYDGLKSIEANKYYVLDADIDMTGKDWTPIEDFSGYFNGNGHTIYNFTLGSNPNGGFFANITETGVVENVIFNKATIDGEFDNVGVVAGVNNGVIGKVFVNATINNTKANSNSGLIAGMSVREQNTAYINMCSTNGSLSANGKFGGIVGYNKSSVVLNCKAIIKNASSTNSESMFGGIVGLNESTIIEGVYRPCAVAKSYAIVEGAQGANIGAVVGENKENNSGNTLFFNKYQDLYYALGEDVSVNSVAKGASTSADLAKITYVANKSALLEKETYLGFNFESVWNIEQSKYAEIDLLGTYETLYIRDLKKEISNEDNISLIDFLDTIRTNPSNDSVYTVKEDVTYDLAGINWETVATSSQSPMKASIKVEDGVTCVIKNFKLQGTNNSFFGYVGQGAIIDGIRFENVTLNNENVTSSAVVATQLLSGATLKKIEVVNAVSINTNADYVGVVVAVNNGNIKDCSVVNDNELTIKVKAKPSAVYFGSIAGQNEGEISGVSADKIKLETLTESGSGSFMLGGIVGNNNSEITNATIDGFNLSSNNEGQTYVGGIVGYVSTNATLEKCIAKQITVSLGMNRENYIGGVAGNVMSGAKLSTVAFVSGSLTGNKVAGIASVNNGTIITSYAQGSVKGAFIAGLVASNFGSVSNCYTLTALTGESDSSIVCGLVANLAEGSSVDRCFSSASFSGKGSKFVETASEFRWNSISTTVRNWFGGDQYHYGTITNSIMINYGDAKIQATSVFGGTGDFIKTTDEECRGNSGDYSVFIETAEFSTTTWNFDNKGSYPTLKAFE